MVRRDQGFRLLGVSKCPVTRAEDKVFIPKQYVWNKALGLASGCVITPHGPVAPIDAFW